MYSQTGNLDGSPHAWGKRHGPATLRQMFITLECLCPPEQLAEIRQLKSPDLTWACLGFSLAISERWVNGRESYLANKLASMGAWAQPRSLSMLIVELFWLYLTEQCLTTTKLHSVLSQYGICVHTNKDSEGQLMALLG